ncbi:18210_t:CDS:1, partial [Dentiscutata erythropus]
RKEPLRIGTTFPLIDSRKFVTEFDFEIEESRRLVEFEDRVDEASDSLDVLKKRLESSMIG